MAPTIMSPRASSMRPLAQQAERAEVIRARILRIERERIDSNASASASAAGEKRVHALVVQLAVRWRLGLCRLKCDASPGAESTKRDYSQVDSHGGVRVIGGGECSSSCFLLRSACVTDGLRI